MYVLGVNAHEADASAALLLDGELIAAVEEERLRRVKHWKGFPSGSIRRVLEIAGIDGRAVAHVAVSRDARANRIQRATFLLRTADPVVLYRRVRHGKAPGMDTAQLARSLSVRAPDLPPRHAVEHHPAHMASAFFASPFEEAAVGSVDGFGDFVSTCTAVGRDRRLDAVSRVFFPHSLGALYTAVSQYLGFPRHGDEYKVMGLAAHGRPTLYPKIARAIRFSDGGRYRLDLSFFRHGSGRLVTRRGSGDPSTGMPVLYSPRLVELLGPARDPGEPVSDRHRDVAASLQRLFEEGLFHVLGDLWSRTRIPRLAMAGGCLMNSVAVGKIRERTPFREVFIQPAAGDSGTSLGAALAVCHQKLGRPRRFVMQHAFWGTSYEDAVVERLVAPLARDERFSVSVAPGDAALCEEVADALATGLVVGWFQGRMEWGPRALGNRSILADPRRPDIREHLNAKVKLRERFRPFACSILEAALGDWFEGAVPDGFMLHVFTVAPSARSRIPAVTHVDGTCRIHSVRDDVQPLFAGLIRAFERRTGVPLVLNTSFNENEPIVDTPAQALDCFLRTNMDLLVIHRTLLRRPSSRSAAR